MKFKLHLVPQIQHAVFGTLVDQKSNRQKSQVNGPTELRVGDTLIKDSLRVFLPKSFTATDGKYDTTCLKAIMNNCKIFAGWVSHNHSESGWFQVK